MSVNKLRSNASLVLQLVRREVIGRYRGSLLGIAWSLLTPLFMLVIYTFVFSTIFKARWSSAAPGDMSEHPLTEFAIILFTGLVVFQLFSEVVNRAPTLILQNINYVKKIVFPLEILPVVALGSALFHVFVSLVVLFAFIFLAMGAVPLTAIFLPVLLTPYALVILGLAWILASLGVYFRDIAQFLSTIVMALMFLSPIFFPSTALPDWLRPYLALNPIALPVEEARNVLIWGRAPDWGALGLYSLVAAVVAPLGFVWFQKTRKGFADVI